MIIFDFIGHLVSTENADELHEFAHKIGLKRSWYQTPGREENHAHYDLIGDRMINEARDRGAVEVSPERLVRRAWWSKS